MNQELLKQLFDYKDGKLHWKESHDDIIKRTGKSGKHQFVLSNKKIADRKEAAKVAKAAGEVKDPGKKLHSHELRKGLKK